MGLLDNVSKRAATLNERIDPSVVDASDTYVKQPTQHLEYKVMQIVLKEALFGSGSKNLSELENVLNKQAASGWRLHTISTTSSGTKGLGGGDRIQATLTFERNC